MSEIHGVTAESFARLALGLHQEPGVDETIAAVVRFAVRMEHCSRAGIVMAQRGGGFEPGPVTDPSVAKAQLHQLDFAEGPVTAGEELVVVPDTVDDDRWPGWSRAAAALGLRSVLAVRLSAGGPTLGVLELFDTRPYAFEAEDVRSAQLLAVHASIAVAGARQAATLWRTIEARKAIGQAQGILMERFGLTPEQAFGVLRRYSQDNNTKLREVAHRLIDSGRLPDGS